MGGNLSPEFRKAQPGAFYALYSCAAAAAAAAQMGVWACGGAAVHGPADPHLNPHPPGCLCRVIGFPLGLVLIVFCGGDLFTGNCLYSLVAVLEGAQPLPARWLGVAAVALHRCDASCGWRWC